MSDNPPAFPTRVERGAPLGGFDIIPGMTLRDWFAGQVLAGSAAEIHMPIDLDDQVIRDDCALLARICFAMADAMLAERSK